MPESNDAAGKEISQTAVNGNGANGVKPNDTPDVDEFGLPIKKHKAPLPVTNGTSDAEDDAHLQEQHQSNGDAPQSAHQRVPTQQLHPASENEVSDSGDDEFKDAQSTPNPTTPSLATPNPEPQEPRTPVPDTASVSKETSQQTAKVAEHNPTTLEAQKPKDEAQGNMGPEKGSSGPTPEFTGLERVQSPEPPRETVRELAHPAEDDAPKSAKSSDSVNSLPKLDDVKDMPRKQDEENAKGHKRGQANGTNGSSGQVLSEWSHQQLTTKVTKEEESEEDEWQTMPAFAPYDMYDDDNKLIAREAHESDDEANAYSGLGGAGKGYTRVQLDEDAQSATSLDENTQYLFKEANGTGAGEMEDEEQRDALSQMQATKDLLTEGQRIAYVGMTRLVLSTMLKEAESIEATKGSKKEVQMAAEAMKMWTQKMMVRLYAHMDISTDEQIMVEQLAEHGVVPSDLTPTLMQNARVKNPMAEKEDGSSASLKSPLSPRTESLASTDKSPRHSISSPKFSHMPYDNDDEEPAQTPPPYEEHEGEDLPQVRTPSQLPTTQKIDIDLRWTVLCDLFLTLIADSVYDARSRVLLEKVGQNMDVSWLEICRFEKRVTDALEMQQAAEKENWNEDEHKENRRKMALKKRYIMMGLATVGGSLVIGLSAGLLAPVIGAGLAAGFTTIGVAGTSGFLAGTAGAAIITSSASAAGGIIAVKAANRRTGAVKTFEYRPLHNNKRVNLIVTVSGWMTGKVDDVRLPYSTVDPVMGDIYSVLWEPEMLQSMGDTINILATEALTQGLQQVLGSTLLIGLMAALQLPVVLSKLAYLIDNPWTVSLDRANSAGLILADSLIDRNLGTRPITFVGYSLGSRVIFSCLRELARKGAYGLVQNVYLFGSPVVAKKDEYLKARSVVAGRFVNGYARNDWILGYLFRLTSGGISRVAGLAPVQGIANLENVDVTDLVPGHMAYRTAMPKLLREVGWSVESDEFTEIEDPDPENHQARQRELINEIEEARKEFEKKEKEGKGKFGFFSRKKKAVVDRKEWETYEESKGESAGSPYGATEDANGNNHGVLFDVDAIRAQLASEQEEELEVKELKSTLPPMKLDLAAPIPSAISPRLPLRESQSYDAGLKVHDYSRPQSRATSPRLSSSDRPNDFAPAYSPGPKYPKYDYEAEEELQMTFDTAYHSPPRSTRTSFTAPTPLQPSPMADTPARASNVQRPDLKSSTSMPTTTSTTIPTINFDHNAWADEDEDFGKEKEIEMTFA